eukprot:9011935-Pyramimonas_sp.AAC.1
MFEELVATADPLSWSRAGGGVQSNAEPAWKAVELVRKKNVSSHFSIPPLHPPLHPLLFATWIVFLACFRFRPIAVVS